MSEENHSPQRDAETDSHVTDNTPCKDIKISLFRSGVTCTSTPLHEFNIKNEIENLSVIKEEDEESVSFDHNQPKTAPAENVIAADEPGKSNLTKDPSKKDVLDLDIENNISNLSVIRKDEISLLIDLPNETVLKEDEIKFNENNLTLSVKNSESIVYKNIVDKTIDDLLVADELISIKEINNLETESDRKQILDKAAALKEFVSSDAEENKDNNDPEWELLKKLETDDERYKAVRKIWRNLTIPDLKQNLSTFNWRKKNSLPALKNVVPIKTNETVDKKKTFTYHCTEVFDIGIKKLYDFYERQVQGINLDFDKETSLMMSLKKKPRLETRYINPRRNYKSDLEKLKMCIQERLQRHKEAKKEIEAVHSFYNGLKNQGNGGYGNMMQINHMERQSILDTENMVSSYTSWYPDHP